MNHTQTKTFIAFTNKVGKDKFWITGCWVREEDSPQIFPYETKEEKDSANLTAYRNTYMGDSDEIEGVILTVSSQRIPMISKEKAAEIEMKFFGNTEFTTTKMKKSKEVVKEPVKEIIKDVPKEVVKEVKPEQIEVSEPKKRGRPRLNRLLEE